MLVFIKDKVISGEAFNNAEKIYENKQKQNKIKEAIPRAWYKLINESNEELIKLISETTENISGYYPQIEEIEEFLGGYLQNERPVPNTTKINNNINPKKEIEYIIKGNTVQKIISFKLKDNNVSVKSWRELLLKTCEIILATVGQLDLQKVLKLEVKKRPYFSKDPTLLRSAEKIKNTDIYVETNLSANSKVQLSKIVISLFGYQDKDLIIVSEYFLLFYLKFLL